MLTMHTVHRYTIYIAQCTDTPDLCIVQQSEAVHPGEALFIAKHWSTLHSALGRSAIAEQSLGRASANIWTLSKHFSQKGERPLNSRVNCFYGTCRKLVFLENCRFEFFNCTMDFLLLCQLSQQLWRGILNSPHFAILEPIVTTHIWWEADNYFGSIKIDDCNDDDGRGKEGGGEKDVKGWAELGHPQFYSDEQALLPLLNTRPPPPYIPPYVQIYTQVPLSITHGMR